MTSPLPHGFPDWGRYVASAARTYVDEEVAFAATGATDVITTFVGDTPRVSIRALTPTENMSLGVRFYDFAPIASPPPKSRFDAVILTGGVFAHTITSMAPFMRITIIGQGAPGSVRIEAREATQPGTTLQLIPNPTNVLVEFNASIAAGTNVTTTALAVWPGEAHWFVSATAQIDHSFFIESLNGLGGVDQTLMRWAESPGHGSHGIVFLPPAPIRINIFNLDVVSSTFRAGVVGKLSAGGI